VFAVRSRGICDGQNRAGQVFSDCFSFLSQLSFHQLLHSSLHCIFLLLPPILQLTCPTEDFDWGQ
jgi:hypothetical protein